MQLAVLVDGGNVNARASVGGKFRFIITTYTIDIPSILKFKFIAGASECSMYFCDYATARIVFPAGALATQYMVADLELRRGFRFFLMCEPAHAVALHSSLPQLY